MNLETLARNTNKLGKLLEADSNYLQSHAEAYLNPPATTEGRKAFRALKQAAKSLGVRVCIVKDIGGRNEPGLLGRFNPANGIELRGGRTPNGYAATLAHELSHAVDRKDEQPTMIAMILGLTMLRDEVIAESSAYLVLKGLGVDWESSALYIARGGARAKDIRQYAGDSMRIAQTILAAAKEAQ